MASKRSNRNGIAMRHSVFLPMFIAASAAALVLAACGGSASDPLLPTPLLPTPLLSAPPSRAAGRSRSRPATT